MLFISPPQRMVAAGVDIIDIGGESTRPGAAPVAEHEELQRVVPAIRALRASGIVATISIDTQRASVRAL
jgi:dihydropteroate synthase